MIKLNPVAKEILEWIYCIVIAVILALIVKYFIGTPTIVQQTSMYPTLKQNQRLILNRIPRTFHQMPERGDIITFEAPTNSYLEPTQENINLPVAEYKYKPSNIFDSFRYYVLELGKKSYIKRVIALPGERVKIENGKVYINGQELEESYLQPGVETKAEGINSFIVPEGYVFAMGDNRSKSTDCRAFGCIPLEKIESKVWIRFWPFDVFGTVK